MSAPTRENHEITQRLAEVRNYKVVKSNDLIQKSRFTLSSQEQKIILYLISQIKPEDMELKEHIFEIREFCKICGIDSDNGKNYKNIKNAIKTLADKSVWLIIEDETEILVRWVSNAWVNKKSGIIKIRLDENMKPYLLQLQERFTSYELLYTLAMRSQYSIRLYEILRSYEYENRPKKFDMDELKRLLSAETYRRFPDFKRYVLDISMREINELSDINVTYEIEKVGRRYAKIIFSIKLKKDIDDRLNTWARIDEILNPAQISFLDNIGYNENGDN